MPVKCHNKSTNSGFTLVELIIGIVVMSIAFSVITSLLLPTEEQSADQLQQIRAAELGQSMLNEILSKAFDENSDMAGGLIRCGENAITCTSAGNLGRDGETSRALFNDVDDYIGTYTVNNAAPYTLSTATGIVLQDYYQGFTVEVTVEYDSSSNNVLQVPVDNLPKIITITITTPTSSEVVFSGIKANF
jgi:MSHA pilin protein MshD